MALTQMKNDNLNQQSMGCLFNERICYKIIYKIYSQRG